MSKKLRACILVFLVIMLTTIQSVLFTDSSVFSLACVAHFLGYLYPRSSNQTSRTTVEEEQRQRQAGACFLPVDHDPYLQDVRRHHGGQEAEDPKDAHRRGRDP